MGGASGGFTGGSCLDVAKGIDEDLISDISIGRDDGVCFLR